MNRLTQVDATSAQSFVSHISVIFHDYTIQSYTEYLLYTKNSIRTQKDFYGHNFGIMRKIKI